MSVFNSAIHLLATNHTPSPPPTSHPNDYAQDWLENMTSTSFPQIAIFFSMLIFSILFLVYDYFRPTQPVRFVSRLRRKRVANWAILTFCISAEVTALYSLYILSSAPKKVLDVCGLTYNQVYIINAVRFFVKPVGLIVNGLLIDKFKKLQAGKYLLIFSLLLQATLNFLTGTAVTWGQSSSDNSNTGSHSVGLLSESTPGNSIGIGIDTSFWIAAKVPMFFVTYIIGAYLHTFSELSLIKICAIWYKGKEERGIIAGLLNIVFCYELVMAYPFNAYLFKIFRSVSALLYVSTGLLSIGALCCLFLNIYMSPQDDLNYYMCLLHTQQTKEEEIELSKGKDLNLEAYLDEDVVATAAVATPNEHDVEHALEEMTPEQRDHHDHHIELNQQIEDSILATKFPFRDPLRLNAEDYTFSQVILNVDLWLYMLCWMALGIIHEDWYTWILNQTDSHFNVSGTSILHSLLVIFLTLAPVLSGWFSVALNSLFTANSGVLSMALLASVCSVAIAVSGSVVAFTTSGVAFVIFAVITTIIKTIVFGIRRYWELDLGGAGFSGTVTAVLSCGWYIGNGIGSLLFRFKIQKGYTFHIAHSLLIVFIPLCVAIVFIIVAFKQVILSAIKRRLKR
jgi:hypothetical protein